MADSVVKLLKRESVAKETMAFYFEKPADFSFKAGQYVDIELLDQDTGVDDDKWHSFSIASTPAENYVMVATRMRDTKFKNKLKDAESGYEVGLHGPNGSFLLHNDSSKPAVMLAGGIGITPMHSMIFDAEKAKPDHKITLFYSDGSPAEIAFTEQFNELTQRWSNFQLIETFTHLSEASDWQGETGRIDQTMLTRHLQKLIGPIYYLAGSQGFVNAMHTMLNGAGVNDDDIRSEDFPGY